MPSIYANDPPQGPARGRSIYADDPVDNPPPPSTASSGAMAPKAPEEPGLFAKIIDFAKRNLGEHANRYVTNAAIGTAGPEGVAREATQGRDLIGAAQQAGEQAKAGVNETLGTKGYLPNGPMEQVLDAATGGVTDPMTYLTPGGQLLSGGLRAAGMGAGKVAAMGAAKTMGEGAGRAVAAGASAAGKVGAPLAGVAGRAASGGMAGGQGEVGRLIAEQLGFGTVGQAAASFAFPAATGAATGAAGRAVNQAMAGSEKLRGLTPEAAKRVDAGAGAIADARIRSLIAAAIEAEGGIGPMKAKLEQAIADSRAINHNLPTAQQLPDNVVIRDAVLSALARDSGAEFRGKYDKQIREAREALDRYKTSLFGEAAPEAARLAAINPADPRQMPQGAIVTNATQRATNSAALERAIADESAKIAANPDKLDVARSAQAVIDAKRAEAKAKYGPVIEKAITDAEARGVKVQPKDMEALIQSAVDLQDKAFMSGMPEAVRRAVAKAGEPPSKSGLLGPSGKPLTADQAGSPITLRDLDEMDRGVNAALRGMQPGSDQYRKLTNLKQSLEDARKNADPKFAAEYADAKKAYRDNVAIPWLNNDAIKVLTRDELYGRVAGSLSNKGIMEEFLKNGGPEAAKVGEEALTHLFAKAAMRDGALDPAKAQRFLRDYGPTVDLVPGLREKLATPAKAVEAAKANAAAIEERLKDALLEREYRATGKTAAQIGADLVTNPSNVDKFLASYKGSPEALKAARSVALDYILQHKDPLAMMKSPDWQNSLPKLFGKTYMDDLAKIEQVQRAMRLKSAEGKTQSTGNFQADTVGATDPLAKYAEGLNIPFVFGTLRNPVMSTPVKISRILSKAVFGRTTVLEDKAVKEMLLDPDFVRAQVAAIEKAGVKPDGTVDMQKLQDALRTELSTKLGPKAAEGAQGAAIDAARAGTIGATNARKPADKKSGDDEFPMMFR